MAGLGPTFLIKLRSKRERERDFWFRESNYNAVVKALRFLDLHKHSLSDACQKRKLPEPCGIAKLSVFCFESTDTGR